MCARVCVCGVVVGGVVLVCLCLSFVVCGLCLVCVFRVSFVCVCLVDLGSQVNAGMCAPQTARDLQSVRTRIAILYVCVSGCVCLCKRACRCLCMCVHVWMKRNENDCLDLCTCNRP